MKKFSSVIPVNPNGMKLLFEEHLNVYSLESILNTKNVNQGSSAPDKGTSAAVSKKINLFEIRSLDVFIANSIFYSTYQIIDLKAELITNKY